MASYYASIDAQVINLERTSIATARTQLFAGFLRHAVPNAASLACLKPAVQAAIYQNIVGVVNSAHGGDPPTNELVTAMSNIYTLVTAQASQADGQPVHTFRSSELLRSMSFVKSQLQEGDRHSLGASSTLCRLGYRQQRIYGLSEADLRRAWL